jgi:lipopolysaccharide/colanic/teichoic acid biosynthesis glycosyltransferase
VTSEQWVETVAHLPASPSHRVGALAGRCLDVMIALALLMALLPVLTVIALAIRLDSPGPAVYRQRRVGFRGHEFLVNKFRSMRADANPQRHQEYVHQLIDCGDDGDVSHEGLYKLVVDDRVTRVGRFLRKWSLDELPQLWNVLRGDMSLVGPRPVIPYEVERYPDWYHARFTVKPGMTGLWQVSGRNERTYEEMVRFDIAYATTRSFVTDLGILARTVWVVIRRRGAA